MVQTIEHLLNCRFPHLFDRLFKVEKCFVVVVTWSCPKYVFLILPPSTKECNSHILRRQRV